MTPVVGIVTLGAANRRSIEAALQRAGALPRFIEEPAGIASCDALVLPGVANFGYIAEELDRTGMRAALTEAASFGVPLLGICVGYQMLFDGSEEAPRARGLGFLRGEVRRLRTPRVPHMGWNRVEPIGSTFYGGWAYFANAYAPGAGVPGALATTQDGEDCFASAAASRNVRGVQFHPERSGAYGASILAAFVQSAASARSHAG
ncbi:MAG TPA: imidazole glycerol phosphate synthase subunit HisH [Candidatus Acidoferrales bacterium]|nr:imidazole glycerol phosphate synthase subunit HisH [Candidatus Acidoferrales bacterium]